MDTTAARFHYARAGTGPPVLLLPGAGGWKLTFQAMIGALAQHHTVYALDPPGQGRTEIRDRTFPFGVDAIARSIGGFLEAVGVTRTAIVGHSWGGGFALRFAELYPERVVRLALIAPAGIDVKDPWEFRFARLPLVGDLAVLFMTATAVRHMLRKSFTHQEHVPIDRVDEFLRTIRSPHRRAARLSDMLRVERSVQWRTTEQHLDLVEAPVLLMWGTDDRYFPVRLIERFTTRLPTVDAHVLPHGGHSLHDDLPEQTLALLTPFLTADDVPRK
ncbi:alpha/beta fold hydrolase [Kibdelosporangium persicum]|uniref:alpha/beta fold hydrolase n=1 Tax=Kibdelosporangium persicum TaxID=2698649 RepID=UPI0028A60B0D|nr:alpha/beta hydrolase [Kibdelosporangium persicum]